MKYKGISIALWVGATVVMAGCGGSDGSDSAPRNSNNQTQTLSGQLVAPERAKVSSARILSATGRKTPRTADCPDVPAGYTPLATVEIQFVDANGAVLDTAQSDNCGLFTQSVPLGVSAIVANPSGMKPIQAPASTFSGATPGLVSSVPADAHFLISVLQYVGEGKLAFSITDDQTGKAVLGLDPATISVMINQQTTALTNMQYGVSQSDNASVSIVMDMSGSMGSEVFDANNNGVGSREFLAARAAHALLDGLAAGKDEVGLVYFNSNVYTMNDITLADNYTFISRSDYIDHATSTPVPFSFSATGLSSDFAPLHTLIDANEGARSGLYIWNLNNPVASPLHTQTRTDILLSNYPGSGSTAFYDGTAAGIELLVQGQNARKIVVALTDGEDNSSTNTHPQVIEKAKTAGIPLYTIAFGSEHDVNETVMQQMAQDTGGEYKRVNSADITGLFQSIQTGIRFQYLGTLAAQPASGQTLTITLSYLGETIERSLVLN